MPPLWAKIVDGAIEWMSQGVPEKTNPEIKG
jgi:hypothetical protein